MKELRLNQETMSSSQLSELLSYDKSEINRKIRNMFRDEIAHGDFPPAILNPNGAVSEYYLPEIETHMFVAKNDIGHLRNLVEYWVKRKSKHLAISVPQNFAQALQLAADQQKQLEYKDELIIASNEASIKAGEVIIREFVKSTDIIEVGEKLFYKWLRDQKIILMHSNEPYQHYVTRGFFTYRPSDEKINGKYRHTIRITPRGKVWLAAKYMKLQDGE